MNRMLLLISMILATALVVYANAMAYHGEKDDIKNLDAIERNHPELADDIREYLKADKQLNAIYKMLMEIYEKADASLGNEVIEDMQNRLETAQVAWLKYRDLAAESETSVYYSKDRYYVSMAELTRQRVERLKGMLENMRDGFGGKGPHSFVEPARQALEKIRKMEEEK